MSPDQQRGEEELQDSDLPVLGAELWKDSGSLAQSTLGWVAVPKSPQPTHLPSGPRYLWGTPSSPASTTKLWRSPGKLLQKRRI